MEYEVFLSKNSFLKSLIKEVQVVEGSVWDLLNSNKQESIPEKIDYMQELIIQVLRVLNDIEVEILLFKVEKSDLGKKVEEDLEELYVLLEMQKRQLADIMYMQKEDVARVLDGKNADVAGFSESSQRISALLEKIDSDGLAFAGNVEDNRVKNSVGNS
jgi:hypothetical protein